MEHYVQVEPLCDLEHTICQSPFESDQREWLLTNGLGSYASSTISGANTRRHHGWLVAALDPPVRRHVMLAKCDELLSLGGESAIALSSNHFTSDSESTNVYVKCLTNFRLHPYPVFIYSPARGVVIEKTMAMMPGVQAIAVRYRVLENALDEPLTLILQPLMALRDFNALQSSAAPMRDTYTEEHGRIIYPSLPGLPPVHFTHNAVAVNPRHKWLKNFFYARESEREDSFTEDLYLPFELQFSLSEQCSAWLIAGIGANVPIRPELFFDRALEHFQHVIARIPAEKSNPVSQALFYNADGFIARRGSSPTILAGYPWFADWGRDAMIALPGLLLTTGRTEEARDLLLHYLKFYSKGMIPNFFPENGQPPAYNTIDATLWFINAIYLYHEKTGDLDTVRNPFYFAIRDSILNHIRGTRFGIKCDIDGLLMGGDATTQLTWMDVSVNGRPVTPRHGKAVEINALWFNALHILLYFADLLDDQKTLEVFAVELDKVQRHFNEKFWYAEGGYLFDCLIPKSGDTTVSEAELEERLAQGFLSRAGHWCDTTLRPNQLLAISLPFPVLFQDRWEPVMEKVSAFLLTPYGLRTLPSGHPAYCPRYEGVREERDAAYHQGTVWAWLIGPYLDAYRRVLAVSGADSEIARARREDGASPSQELLREILKPVIEHLDQAGLGSISEIFDAEPPHRPRGCIAQAWSVAEVLRQYMELF
ncbi:MAG: amylo-alpha-1,6-glucosidase [Candidatus Sumerlaeia bacterium]